MADRAREKLDALSIGRPSRGWTAGVLVCAAMIGCGTVAAVHELRHGMIVTGLRTIGLGGAAWGLYISFAVYAIGVSFAGISTAALVRLFRLEPLRPLTRAAELLTIVGLMLGGLCILADLGRPLAGLRYLPRFARPASPFFGTFTLVVSGYLFASLVYFYLAGRADAALCARIGDRRLRWLYTVWASGYRGTGAERARHERAAFWLSIFVLPLLVVAHSTLGFVFGIQGARPGWFSALQAPGFVVLAGTSGVGLLAIIAAAMRRALGLAEVIRPEAFRLLSNFLWVLALVYLYFMVVEELTASYAASAADTRVAHAIVEGAYAPLFWATVVCLAAAVVIGFVQFARGVTSIAATVVAGVLVNVAALAKRILIVVPSQTVGMLLPYRRGSYVPAPGELAVLGGLVGLGVLVFLVFLKVFPLVPIAEAPAPEAEAEGGDRVPSRLRAVAFWATLTGGLALAVAGFLLSLRVGTLPYADPVVPFSPVLFIVGVMMTFYSAAVYETVPPEPRRDEAAARWRE